MNLRLHSGPLLLLMRVMEPLVPTSAWAPLTPQGVAAYARASVARLWITQSVFAALVAAAVWFWWQTGCFPTIREALQKLPPTGEIRAQRLEWVGDSPVLLAEGRFLAFSVDLDHSGDIRSPAHWQVEFGREGLLIHSLLGYAEWAYPAGWRMVVNRPALEPWWLAREWLVLLLGAVFVVISLLLAWSLVAGLYVVPTWLIAFFANRDLPLLMCWRLAGAALMPGALLMALAVFLYALGLLDLVAMGFVTAGHLVVGWIFIAVSVWFLPPEAAATPQPANPFKPDADS